MKEKLITIANYAKKHKKSTTWAYNQASAGKIKIRVIDGIKFVVI